MEVIAEHRAHGGRQLVIRHTAETTRCDMTFGLYLPPATTGHKVPLLWYLSGLTCTHENAMTKSGAQAAAARAGIALVFPDTSPRGDNVPDDDSYDLGQGAGFYVNATAEPWATHFQMWDYLSCELTALLFAEFPLAVERQAITGHSMGGHGALTLAMHFPDRFASVSAFAPIAHPTRSDWGRKQLSAYLGKDESTWAAHDATLLMRERGFDGTVLVDQGSHDQFLDLLMPEVLAEAMAARRQSGSFRVQPGYDHSYFFVASFIDEHVDFHARALADR